MKIKLMLLLQSTYCSEGVADFNVMIDGDDDGDDDDVMLMIMTIVSVEQRPGWGEKCFTCVLVILRHKRQSSGCDCTLIILICRCCLQPVDHIYNNYIYIYI